MGFQGVALGTGKVVNPWTDENQRYQLSDIYYVLFIMCYSVLIAYCLLPIIHFYYLLNITYNQLPVTHYLFSFLPELFVWFF